MAGYFTIVDRRKDMILVSGFNVYPNEVEAVLAGLAGVKDCAVIGVPDAASGEAVKAFIVCGDPALDAKTVRHFCRCELASYKVPRLVEFRDDLPKSNIDKFLRKDLRQNPPPNGRSEQLGGTTRFAWRLDLVFCMSRQDATVEPRTLTPSILVRIQVPQPGILLKSLRICSFLARRNSPDNSAR